METQKTIKKEMTIFVFLSLLLMLFALTFNVPARYDEIDSYALPAISLQYRGSLVITQQDIDQAKLDFPNLYYNINSYDDLRNSKLAKIDETHWYPYYFPIYPLLCVPMKLLLQFFGLNQEMCFVLTNKLLLFFAIALCLIRKDKGLKSNVLLSLLLCASPIFVYLHYIGIESIAFSCIAMAMICWEQKRYKIGALIISVVCMANPMIMLIGIAMFAEFAIDFYRMKRQNHSRLNLSDCKGIISLCMCYVPSLVPFATNLYYLHVLNPTFGMADLKAGNLVERFGAYFLDLNLGIASFAPMAVAMLAAALIVSIVKKNFRVLLFSMTAVALVAGVSIPLHINCGMQLCARYIIWIYPVVCFSIVNLYDSLPQKSRKWHAACISISVLVTLFVMQYNGYYTSLELSNISKALMNRFPQLYYSVCPSTFNSRASHRDGGYEITYSTYFDSRTGELRKLQYRNTGEIQQEILRILKSENDSELSELKARLPEPDDQIHYINIGPGNESQYVISENPIVYDMMKRWFEIVLPEQELPEFNNHNLEAFVEIIEETEISNEELVDSLYQSILARKGSEGEIEAWCTKIENGVMNKEDIVKTFVYSEEARLRYGYNIK